MKNNRKELIGLVGAIGMAIAIAGFVGGYMSTATTTAWAFGVWIVGAMVVRVLTNPPDK